ncbi:MAG: hypothetical protein Q7R76_00440 [Candidatus Woesearchaeota archaeon]|nr:hypothetical protein [Candidatus Woesearchaeota archaeon]
MTLIDKLKGGISAAFFVAAVSCAPPDPRTADLDDVAWDKVEVWYHDKCISPRHPYCVPWKARFSKDYSAVRNGDVVRELVFGDTDDSELRTLDFNEIKKNAKEYETHVAPVVFIFEVR